MSPDSRVTVYWVSHRLECHERFEAVSQKGSVGECIGLGPMLPIDSSSVSYRFRWCCLLLAVCLSSFYHTPLLTV